MSTDGRVSTAAEYGTSGLEDKTVLITGSSRGIGRTAAELLHSRGARVILHARARSAATDGLVEILGDRARTVFADLAAPTGAADLWRQAVETFGGIDVLVNNAGAWLPSELTPTDAWRSGWDANMALNLTAPADLCREALLHFPTRGGGIVVNLTSRSAHRGDDAEHLAYGAAKGGLLALTRGIARGYGRQGVLAYAVSPGWVATDLSAGAIDEAALAGLPLGEVTPASDVAEVIAFLASGRARHATGTTIDITGADYVR